MIKHAKCFDTWSVCPHRRGLVSVGRVLDLAFMAALSVPHARVESKVASRCGAGRRYHLRRLLDDQSASTGASRKTVV